MSYEVVFKSSVYRDLAQIARFIAQDTPARAKSFVDELEQKAYKIGLHPFAYQKFGRSRRAVHKKYIILYRVNVQKKRVTIHFMSQGSVDWHKLVRL